MNAINLPLSPTPFELDPEDAMLGKISQLRIMMIYDDSMTLSY